MIIITSRNTKDAIDWRVYQIAGQVLASQFEIIGLEAFATEFSDHIDLPSAGFEQELTNDNAKLHYEGMAPFEHRLQQVVCFRYEHVIQVNVSGMSICQVDLANSQITVLDEALFATQLGLEIITGPALVLLLAQKSVFCLHAGAVAAEDGNMVFIAESGAGKSTLSAGSGEGWQQICDDILPLSYFDHRYRALLDFPQLKLADAQAALLQTVSAKEMLPIDVIFRISNTPSNEITFEQLTPQNAVLQIVRHTVAAKLFTHEQLTQHLEFARYLVRKVPVYALSYPRDLNELPQLRDSVSVFLATSCHH